MTILYTDANPRTLAYYIQDGGSDYCHIPEKYTSMEAEYLAIIYGLNAYYIRWNKELDARTSDMDAELYAAVGDVNFAKTGSPADHTRRQLPPPVLVRCDNEVVVKQLSRQNIQIPSS